MGFLDRLRKKKESPVASGDSTALTPAPPLPPAPSQPAPEEAATKAVASLYSGDETLEVVGESNYQDALRRIVDSPLGDAVRHAVVAVLVPEPSNPYDSNAINVQIEGSIIGYLSRNDRDHLRTGPPLAHGAHW